LIYIITHFHFFLTTKKLWILPFFGSEDDVGVGRERFDGVLVLLGAAVKKELIGRGEGLFLLPID